MNCKRVLVLNHFAVPRGEPGGTRHVELFGQLGGWEAVIIASRLNLTTGRAQQAEPGFLPVAVTPYRNNGLARILNWISFAVMATVAALRQPRADILYGSSPHLLAALAAWAVARARGARFVLEVRDLWPRVLVDMGQMAEDSLIYRFLQRLERFLYERADRIVVLASGSIDALQEMGIAREKIVYIPNAADPEDFQPSSSREALRTKYRFERLTFVYAGAHGPANGLDLLLDASVAAGGDYEVVLVGSGVEKERLVGRVRAEGIARVRFMDPVPKTEMADVLAAADVGVHVLADVDLFRYGVSPNKVFDYMAAALPILTNSPGIVASLVESAKAGIAVGPRSLDDGLRMMMDTAPGGRAEMSKSGSDWIAKNQSRKAMSLRLQEVLQDLVGKR